MNALVMKNIEVGKKQPFADLVESTPGVIESRTLAQEESYSVTVFGFGAGEDISAFSVPGDTFIHVIAGKALITINDAVEHSMAAGECLAVSSNDVYSVHAQEDLKLMIILVKGLEAQ